MEQPATNAVRTSVPAATTTTLLLPTHSARLGATFYNDSTAILYLIVGGGQGSTTDYTVQIAAQGSYELPSPCYVGPISGIWATAAGAVRITELS